MRLEVVDDAVVAEDQRPATRTGEHTEQSVATGLAQQRSDTSFDAPTEAQTRRSRC